jgi:hypothetical protein
MIPIFLINPTDPVLGLSEHFSHIYFHGFEAAAGWQFLMEDGVKR